MRTGSGRRSMRTGGAGETEPAHALGSSIVRKKPVACRWGSRSRSSRRFTGAAGISRRGQASSQAAVLRVPMHLAASSYSAAMLRVRSAMSAKRGSAAASGRPASRKNRFQCASVYGITQT